MPIMSMSTNAGKLIVLGLVRSVVQMTDILNLEWEEHRAELAKTLGVDPSIITFQRNADGTLHVQVGKPSASDKHLAVVATKTQQASQSSRTA